MNEKNKCAVEGVEDFRPVLTSRGAKLGEMIADMIKNELRIKSM